MDKVKKNSVLVVDDERLNILALTGILSPEYVMYAASDALDALETAEEYLPDVILLDVIMPETDGYALLAMLKKNPKTRNIPVIFVTGLSDVEDEEKGLKMGAVDYISKPYSPSIVKSRVHNQIQIREQIKLIEHLSMTDVLTELPNRRSFDQRLELEWNRARRENKPISILIMDVDKFKNYNDTYGHQQGDAALTAVAGSLAKTLKRGGDFAARWGGEEFIVLLPNTNAEGALIIAEQIRSEIEATQIPRKDGVVTMVTISVGVYTATPGRDETADGCISRADTALFKAKEYGRNKVFQID